MALKRILAFALPLILLGAIQSDANAQKGSRRPLLRAGRVLGLGWGNGYHKHGPATNSDYYSAWSSLNSDLQHGQNQSSLRGNSSRWSPLYGVPARSPNSPERGPVPFKEFAPANRNGVWPQSTTEPKAAKRTFEFGASNRVPKALNGFEEDQFEFRDNSFAFPAAKGSK